MYGDRPNYLPLRELDKRWEYADGLDGIDENMSIDNCLHSIFGASKVAADVMCQEFGRYFQMPVGVFRGGCLTGPQHSAVELHGYLVYIIICAMTGKEYQVYGYKGKQVRDQIHSHDVANLFLEFYKAPRCGEVYNMGGGRGNSISILETIDLLAGMGYTLKHSYKPENRVGDHICYISDLSKIYKHFPNWKLEYDLPRIIGEIVQAHRAVAARAWFTTGRTAMSYPKTTSHNSARWPSIHSAMSLSGAPRVALRSPAADRGDGTVVGDVEAQVHGTVLIGGHHFHRAAGNFPAQRGGFQQREAVLRRRRPTFQCRPA